MMHRFGLTSLCVLVLFLHPAAAQSGLMTPEEFLGYPLGDRFTPHHRVIDYFEYVAEASSTVVLDRYGTSIEGRPLILATLTSPTHIARLEEIRTNNLRRTGLIEGEVVEGDPAIVWLSYGVHGNESVSTEAALATLFALADPTNERARAWLDRAVVVLDPCLNPDGRERYVNWYSQAVGAWENPDPASREHLEPWPGGRTNHYLFDLNRDWAWQTQQESQARVAQYRRWMPHVHVDFHEQGVDAPYFFAPAAEPYHDIVTDWQRAFQQTIGRNNARHFDEQGWLYFTREVFDLLYPSYGDTWPTYNGAIGMTYEQAGGGRAGLAIETATGDTLTLADRIAHHTVTGLATVEVSAEHAEQVVSEFAAYYRSMRTNPPGPYRTYIVPASNEVDDVAALTALLDRQGIRYGSAGRERVVRAFDYVTGSIENVRVEQDDLVISALQPASALVHVFFEPTTTLSDSLTYDITAWSLPYVFGLQAYATTEALIPEIQARPEGTAEPGAPEKAYAYLAEYRSLEDLKLLAALMKAGVRVRTADQPFEMDGIAYPAGTLIILRVDNRALGDGFDAKVRDLSKSEGQPVSAVGTGMVTSGPDFGSSHVRFLHRPNIAVVAGEGVHSYAFGEVWHYFEQQLHYPISVLMVDRLAQADLQRYQVLILPNGSYSGVLSDDMVKRIQGWVESGGRLILLESAADRFAGREGFGLKQKESHEPEEEEDRDTDPDRLRRYGQRERDRIQEDVSGSIFAVDMDTSHPLAYGLPPRYFTLKRSDAAYAFLEHGWNVGVLAKDGYRSGFTGSKVQEKLEDGLLFGTESVGKGSVVYLADNPLFRGFWHKGSLLVGNAAFLVGP